MNNSRRRWMLRTGTALGAAFASQSLALRAAAALTTPAQSRGPFYPAELPLDADNDLTYVQGQDAPAAGEHTELSGKIVDERGRAVNGARVEIWQCDANGRYHHPWDRRDIPRDDRFQGYGQFQTGVDGRYRFRTIKPVAYPGRAPHIHFAIHAPGADRPLVTQMYVAGAPQNARDGLLNSVRDARQRERLIVDFRPAAQNLLQARFDIVLGADARHA